MTTVLLLYLFLEPTNDRLRRDHVGCTLQNGILIGRVPSFDGWVIFDARSHRLHALAVSF
jgi:hypothetical protein